jgi:hypothetical protein
MKHLFALVLVLWALTPPAFAQAVAAAPSPLSLNMTDIIVSIIGGVFTIIGLGATYLINKTISDANAKVAFNTQLAASLGALQQTAKGIVTEINPTITVPGVRAEYQPAAQYLLDHVGAEIKQLAISGPLLDSHIAAALGNKEIDANIAIASSNGKFIAPLVAEPVKPEAKPEPAPVKPASPLLGAVSGAK